MFGNKRRDREISALKRQRYDLNQAYNAAFSTLKDFHNHTVDALKADLAKATDELCDLSYAKHQAMEVISQRNERIWVMSNALEEQGMRWSDDLQRVAKIEEIPPPATENTPWYCPRGCQVYHGIEPMDDCGACGTPFTRESESYYDAMQTWEDQQIADYERTHP